MKYFQLISIFTEIENEINQTERVSVEWMILNSLSSHETSREKYS